MIYLQSIILFLILLIFVVVYRSTRYNKKYYEQIVCKVCSGIGKLYCFIGEYCDREHALTGKFKICKGCNGRGIQIILNRIE